MCILKRQSTNEIINLSSVYPNDQLPNPNKFVTESADIVSIGVKSEFEDRESAERFRYRWLRNER